MPASPELLAVLSSLLVLVLAGLTGIVLIRTRRRALDRRRRPVEGWDDVVLRLTAVEHGLDRLSADLGQVRALDMRHIQHLGIVHYDAFRDMGGQLSFSIALLDAHHSGVIVSILSGRDGSRAYAKVISEGHASSMLSVEEQQALSRALSTARAEPRGSPLG